MKSLANTDFAVKKRLIEIGVLELEKFKIHENIPIPNKQKVGRHSLFKEPAEKMKIGNVIFFKKEHDAMNLRSWLKKLGKTGTVRKIKSGKWDGYYGCWRIK